jgi:hypothetical protein
MEHDAVQWKKRSIFSLGLFYHFLFVCCAGWLRRRFGRKDMKLDFTQCMSIPRFEVSRVFHCFIDWLDYAGIVSKKCWQTTMLIIPTSSGNDWLVCPI